MKRKETIKMPVLSSNQKSMRTHVARPSLHKKTLDFKRTKKSGNQSLDREPFSGTQSIDLALKVRSNKTPEPFSFNFDKMDECLSDFDNINDFLDKSLNTKQMKKYIKANQVIFDKMIDIIYSGQWMGIDLKKMFLFFVECFKSKVRVIRSKSSSKSRNIFWLS
jgi:hypothetical protein